MADFAASHLFSDIALTLTNLKSATLPIPLSLLISATHFMTVAVLPLPGGPATNIAEFPEVVREERRKDVIAFFSWERSDMLPTVLRRSIARSTSKRSAERAKEERNNEI